MEMSAQSLLVHTVQGAVGFRLQVVVVVVVTLFYDGHSPQRANNPTGLQFNSNNFLLIALAP